LDVLVGLLVIGKLTSVEHGPERNVKIVISPTEVSSEIFEPHGSYHPKSIDHYEISGMQGEPGALVALTLVLIDSQKVVFYSTHSKFDMALLLDQLDGTIGERRREVSGR
jgi:hypothetical protein